MKSIKIIILVALLSACSTRALLLFHRTPVCASSVHETVALDQLKSRSEGNVRIGDESCELFSVNIVTDIATEIDELNHCQYTVIVCTVPEARYVRCPSGSSTTTLTSKATTIY